MLTNMLEMLVPLGLDILHLGTIKIPKTLHIQANPLVDMDNPQG
jgi:hypothetical protein